MLISAIQQSDELIYLYMHMYTDTHSFLTFFSIIAYHRILNIVPCAIREAFLVAQKVKNLLAVPETQVCSLGQKDPLETGLLPTPVLLPGEVHNRGAWWATVHGLTRSLT